MKTLTKQEVTQTVKEALFTKNPLLVSMLALTPVLGVTAVLDQAITLGILTFLVFIVATLLMSFVSKKIQEPLYVAIQITVIALLVSLAEMILQVSNLALYEDIHVYVALTTISVFMLQHGLKINETVKIQITLIHHSLYGLGYVLALIVFSIIRSVFTTGAVRLFGLQLRLFDVAYSFTLLDTAFGSLLLLGLTLGYIRSSKEGKNV